MKTEFVQFKTDDGAILHGLYFRPDVETVTGIVHVHGLAGNFYENEFIGIMAEHYTRAGYSFLTFNNRGHDYIADITIDNEAGRSEIKGGGAYERFEDCRYDVQGAVSFLARAGVRKICLQGHSSGCNKIVYTMSLDKLAHVCAAVLLSPCDDIGIMETYLGDNFEAGLKQARLLASENKHDSLIDSDKAFYPMSARTYLGYYESGSAQDIFPYRTPDAAFSAFGNLMVPAYVTFGTDGEYLNDSADETISILQKKSRSPKMLASKIVEGSSHSYTGYGQILATSVADWLTQLDTEAIES